MANSSTPPTAGGSSDPQRVGQHIDIKGGDNSPVSVNAPFSYAAPGGTANSNTAPPSTTPAPTPTPWWSRASVVWTAVGSLAAIAAVVVAVIK